MVRTITLKYPGRCRDCGADLAVGEKAKWYGRGKVYGLNCHEKSGGGADLTIEYSNEYHWYTVYEFGVFPRSSVLSGQTMKSFKETFDTVEEAQKAYPNAQVGYRDPMNTFNHLPGEEMTEGGYNDPYENDW